jgi:hypothetical protein
LRALHAWEERRALIESRYAGMAELADAADSKSADRKVVGVRPPLPAPPNFLNKINNIEI